MATSTGIREVLIFAEVEHKVVTVRAADTVVTGKVHSVNPLIVQPLRGDCAVLVNFDMVSSVCVQAIDGARLVEGVRPKGQATFAGAM